MDENKPLWKQLIGPVIFCLFVAAIIIFIINYKAPVKEIPDFMTYAYVEDKAQYVLENDALKFTMDAGTTRFTLLEKATGKEWKSNPDGAESDPLALPDMKKRMNSTLLLTYSNRGGNDNIYDNCQFSIERGIYEIEADDNQIKVKYSIGNTEKVFVIPYALPEEQMNAWLDKMETADRRRVEEYYRRYDINKLKSTDNKDELLEKYPDLAETRMFVLRDNTPDYLKAIVEGFFEGAGYTFEQYEIDKETYGGGLQKDIPLFNVSVVYKLDGNELLVDVPLQEIEYKEDFPIIRLAVLPFFGCATTKDNGYMLVPEGGGGIINFNNGRVTQNQYVTKVYGFDEGTIRDAVVNETYSTYPAYAVAYENSSFLCTLEDGNSYASIKADVSGKLNSYNYIYTEYVMQHQEAYNVAGKANEAVYVYEKQLPQGDLVQRYSFFDTNDYVKLAEHYRSYLEERYTAFERSDAERSVPVAVNILGAVDMVQQKFGIPMSAPLELTTFEEAQWIIDDLKNRGFDNMEVKLSGWANDGEKQKSLNKIKIVKELGSKKDLKNLIAYTNENNIPFYLNTAVMFDYNGNIFSGFYKLRDCARFVTYDICKIYKYSIVYYGADEWYDEYYLLKPALMEKYIANAGDYAKKNNVYGVAFRDAGYKLAGDYNRNGVVSREESKAMQTAAFTKLNESGMKVMAVGGNDYVLENASFITDMDFDGNKRGILDASVPFYQIAIHGYTDYAGESMNLAGDYQEVLLQSAEAGAALSFTFMKENAVDIQRTLYTMYFGADYDKWIDKAQAIYDRYNAELGPVYNLLITDHKVLADGVSCTVYENGTKVYVNYTYEPAFVDGIKVPARDYYVVKGEK